MLTSSFITKKIPGFIALLIYATTLSGILMFFSKPTLIGEVSDATGAFFSLLTGSAGNPGFLLTVATLSLIPFLLKLPRKKAFILIAQFAVLLVLSFAAKTALKHFTEVPRPYSYQLQSLGIVESTPDFYQLSNAKKEKAIEAAKGSVSNWRTSHWQGETNYSFPSGHTIFAAICVVFWGGFFCRRKNFIPTGMLILWATGVGLSRIWLGMHWPTDVLGSICCAGLLYCLLPEWEYNPE